jgi:hypothetical protein
MRAKGKVVEDDTLRPKFKIAAPVEMGERQEPQQHQQRAKGRITEGTPRKPPNHVCYPMLFGPGMPWDFDPKTCTYRDGKGARRVPKCKKCQGNIYPMENHECEGYIPQYDDMTEEREERWEERVRVIREMKRDGWHDETDLEDGREEDYDGGDYCEGDDDGYDCD